MIKRNFVEFQARWLDKPAENEFDTDLYSDGPLFIDINTITAINPSTNDQYTTIHTLEGDFSIHKSYNDMKWMLTKNSIINTSQS